MMNQLITLWKRNLRSPGLWIVSVLFGLLNTAGGWMYRLDRLPRTAPEHFSFWGGLLIASLLFFLVASLLLTFGRRFFFCPRADQTAFPAGKLFLLAFGIILLGWLPWIISYYPFSADYDVYHPISQYLGLSPKSNGFPWFYCCTVGFFYNLGLKLGDKNVGMFLYVLLRALSMSAVYARLVVRLKRSGLRTWTLWMIILFYALVPVWGAYAKHGFKDTLSAALFCWFITLTAEAVRALREDRRDAGLFLLFSVSSLAISLYRNNCIFIAVPVSLLLAIAVLKRKSWGRNRFRLCAMLLAGILVFGGYRVYIAKVEHVGSGKTADALTLPFQQTARTVRDHGEEISSEDQAAIAGILDYNTIGAVYDPLISDPVKNTAHDLGKNGLAYAKAWLRMGFRFPLSYLEALVGQTYGYYAFTGDQALHAGNWNCGMTIFDWVKDPRFSDDFTCDYIDSLEPLRTFLDNWAKIWHRLPVLGWADQMPLYTWLIVLAGLLLFRRKRWLEWIPVMGLLLNVVFCCGSPVNDCFRYFAPIAAAAPAVLLLFRPAPADVF